MSGLLVVLAGLLLLYVTTLQTIPNGSGDPYMRNVGETQIVLNVWGSLHATGYPLYVMTGSALNSLFVALGADAATAPALVSLFWGILAACVVYALALHLVDRVVPAVSVTLLFGLARTVWMHNVVAEISSFSLLLLLLLLALALWRDEIPRLTTHPARVYWLACIGAIALAHHRAFVVMMPALLFAVWPQLNQHRTQWRHLARTSLLLALPGFLVYLYPPLRALSNAAWVYGDPGTLNGFLDLFFGTDANRSLGLQASATVLRDNFQNVNDVLFNDLTVPGLALGVMGLYFAINNDRLWRVANTLILSAGAAYLAHVFFFTETLYALILPVTVSMAFGWLFLIELILEERYAHLAPIFEARYAIALAVAPATLLLGAALYDLNHGFVLQQVRDETGLQTVEVLRAAPVGSTVMLARGAGYFAAGFARDVQGDLTHIDALIDETADFAAIVAGDSPLVTQASTFEALPPEDWSERIGVEAVLNAVAPALVQIGTERDIAANPPEEITVTAILICQPERLVLDVLWTAAASESRDFGVFVHLLDAGAEIIEEADRPAPVFGWRPTGEFAPGERVRDFYTLPRKDAAASVRYGLYYQAADGESVNDLKAEIEVTCVEVP